MDALSNRVQAFLSKMEEEYFFGEGVAYFADFTALLVADEGSASMDRWDTKP